MEQTRRFCVAALRPRAGLACQLGRRFKAFHALRLPRRPATPLRGLRRLPRASAEPRHPLTRLYRFGGAESQKPDTLTAHRERPGERSFFYPFFQPKVDNTFYMARRRQEQTHTQRRDRDMDWRGTSHFLPWMVK